MIVIKYIQYIYVNINIIYSNTHHILINMIILISTFFILFYTYKILNSLEVKIIFITFRHNGFGTNLVQFEI